MRLSILALGLLFCSIGLVGCSGGDEAPANQFSTEKTDPSPDDLVKQKEAGAGQRSAGAGKTRS